MGAAISLEVSTDERYILLGGCDRFDLYEGIPVVQLISFDGNLTLKHQLFLKDESLRTVFRMQWLPDSSYFIASCIESMCVIEYDEQKEELREVKNISKIHGGEIFDFVMHGQQNEIYTVSHADTYIHKI